MKEGFYWEFSDDPIESLGVRVRLCYVASCKDNTKLITYNGIVTAFRTFTDEELSKRRYQEAPEGEVKLHVRDLREIASFFEGKLESLAQSQPKLTPDFDLTLGFDDPNRPTEADYKSRERKSDDFPI